MKIAKFITIFVAFSIITISSADENIVQQQQERQKEWNISVAKRIQETLLQLDRSCADAALKLTDENLSLPRARAILKTVFVKNSFVENIGTINPAGRIAAVYPLRYARVEGLDISDQEHIQKMLVRRKPLLSSVFRAVEGFTVVALQHPITDINGDFKGAISAIFRPEKSISKWSGYIQSGTPYDLWIIDQNGTIIYDFDSQEIGRNILYDQIYQTATSLKQLVKGFADSEQGSGQYEFQANNMTEKIRKFAVWKSINIHDSVWYVVLTRPIEDVKGKPLRRSPANVGIISSEDNLTSLSQNANLINALANKNTIALQLYLENFYNDNPGIYVVQLTDSHGVVRYAYPRGNAVIGYDARKKENTFDHECLQSLKKHSSAKFQQTLLEGGTGEFVLRPVIKNDHAIGVLYLIRIVSSD
jgi:hypothetical protein